VTHGQADTNRDRYSRQVRFAGIGESGQRAIQSARITLVGCGALGSFIAAELVRAGVGSLRIVDRDYVEWSNLQRQILYVEEDARQSTPKAVAAASHLRDANSTVSIECVVDDLRAANAERLLAGSTLVMDATDNFSTRYLVNDLCVRDGLPWVYAAAVSSYGVVMPVVPRETPCLRCVFVTPPSPGTTATCDTAGVLGPAVGVVSSLAVAEGLKLIVGARDKISRGLTWVDVWSTTLQRTELGAPRADCPTCVGGVYEYLSGDSGGATAVLCGRDAIQVRPERVMQIGLPELAERLRQLGWVRATPHLLQISTSGLQMSIFPDGRAIVKGTEDTAAARALYARLVGG
jgi:molybdopterin-synthase adenylyltransferase